MKESTAYQQIADTAGQQAAKVADLILRIIDQVPVSGDRASVITALNGVRKAEINVQGRALHAIEMRLIDPKDDLEVKDAAVEKSVPAIDGSSLTEVLCTELRQRFAALKIAKDAAAPTNGSVMPPKVCSFVDSLGAPEEGNVGFKCGEKIEYRFAWRGNQAQDDGRPAREWRDGMVHGIAADGSGKVLIAADGAIYRCSPENVRKLPIKHPEHAELEVPAPAPANLDR